jgi:hypothetical protein
MTLIEAVQAILRHLHDSPRTKGAYVHWILQFHPGCQPRQMGAEARNRGPTP